MRFQSGRQAAFVLAGLLLLVFCFTDASAQKRRTKRSRRVTNPVTTTATPAPTPSAQTGEPKLISTAEENAAETGTTASGRRSNTRRNIAPQPEEDSRQKMERLSAQVNALNDKLSQMEQQQRTLVDLERLSRAETRAEGLRVQLRDVQEKEGDLQSRAEQLDYESKPEVIERTLAVTGSTRPEELRETRRRQLEAEKSRVQSQLNLLATSRARLETAIANADAEADRIRTRVDAASVPEQTEQTPGTDVGAQPTGTTQPTDTGDGAQP
jgi:chromosome segregation ATPase